jgi:Skp family chaperone for outer membrane proteins
VRHPRFALTAVMAAPLLALLIAGAPLRVLAQQVPAQPAPGQNPAWFVPGQAHPAAPARPSPRPGAPSAAAPAQAIGPEGTTPDADQPGATPQQIQVVLPPAPEVPPIPKGNPPPAAVIGIISVPDVMRASTAYLAVDKELGARRQKLNEDAQKEQSALRDLGQALANDRGKLTSAQISAKERELQDRIAESRRKFADRNRIIQEAGQYALAQIERTLRVVVQQVAVAHGMNLVLHGPQAALYLPEFDITAEVVSNLNKVQPVVTIPPDGTSVLDMKPTAAAPAPTPAAATEPGPPKPATPAAVAPAQKPAQKP